MRGASRLESQRGQTLVLVALLLVVLMGLTSLAADAGYYHYQQRVMQTAADSAALAGASEITYGARLGSAPLRGPAAGPARHYGGRRRG